MNRLRLLLPFLALLLVAVSQGCSDGSSGAADGPAGEEPSARTVLLMEHWRSPDRDIWNDLILPQFNQAHPDIDVRFAPSEPAAYDASLADRLERGLGGDIIVCRPFDESLKLYRAGHLMPLRGVVDFEQSFPRGAIDAWSADDGTPYCVPGASVMHGFVYNRAILAELSLRPPKTEEEFFSLLDAIERDGRYIPLAMGLAETWAIATMGFQNIGPNHWQGEQGRRALIRGELRYTDPPFQRAWEALARWGPYLPEGAESLNIELAQRLFTSGQAAIYPAGSWEISDLESDTGFAISAFPPPPASSSGSCFVSDHTDMGFGINAATRHPEAARVFLEWLAGSEFATIHSNALPGFFSMRSDPVAIGHVVSRTFASWRDRCETAIRSSAQYLSEGEPSHERDLWRVSAAVAAGTMTPAEAGEEVQSRLDSWYTPQG